MWVPTVLFVSCLIASNYILAHRSGLRATGPNASASGFDARGPPQGVGPSLHFLPGFSVESNLFLQNRPTRAI